MDGVEYVCGTYHSPPGGGGGLAQVVVVAEEGLTLFCKLVPGEEESPFREEAGGEGLLRRGCLFEAAMPCRHVPTGGETPPFWMVCTPAACQGEENLSLKGRKEKGEKGRSLVAGP